jgi:hypothetical protein
MLPRSSHGKVSVVDLSRRPIGGATVVIAAENADSPWETRLQTDERGEAALEEPVPAPASVSVRAPGYVPWFGRQALSPSRSILTVTLHAGERVAGRAFSSGQPASDVRVRLVGRENGVWPMPDFWTDSIWPPQEAWALPPADAIHVVDATTDAEGRFAMGGLDSSWSCLITLADPSWTMLPIGREVRPGEQDIMLELMRPTGIDVHYGSGTASPSLAQAHVAIRDERGSSRSFSLQGRDGSASLRFPAPADWRGKLSYDVSLIGPGGVRASRECTGQVGEVTVVEMSLEDEPSNVKVIGVTVEWSDGTPCQEGLMVSAHDQKGRSVAAEVLSQNVGFYRVQVDATAARMELLAKGCLRGWHEAETLEVHELASGSVVACQMPEGADVVIFGPDPNRTTSVLISGSFGATMLDVPGQLRLRSVDAGELTASCSVDGVDRRVSVDIEGTGTFILDLSK